MFNGSLAAVCSWCHNQQTPTCTTFTNSAVTMVDNGCQPAFLLSCNERGVTMLTALSCHRIIIINRLDEKSEPHLIRLQAWWKCQPPSSLSYRMRNQNCVHGMIDFQPKTYLFPCALSPLAQLQQHDCLWKSCSEKVCRKACYHLSLEAFLWWVPHNIASKAWPHKRPAALALVTKTRVATNIGAFPQTLISDRCLWCTNFQQSQN